MSAAEGAQAGPLLDVHAIEDELAKVRWSLRPDGSEDPGESAAEARASCLNLITVVESEAQVRDVTHVLDALATSHPSRTLILLAQEDRGAVKLEAQVSTSSLLDSGRRIQVEQVLLHAHGRLAEHLASLVDPLLIPDLPVMLWWPGPPDFKSRLFNELADLADRLIVDTNNGFSEGDCSQLLKVARRSHQRCAIGDFNWARLMPWRYLMAQFFDGPAGLEQLTQVSQVEAVGGRGPSMQPLLLTGWVQSRLAGAGLNVRREVSSDESLEPGLARLCVTTRGGARFTIERLAEGRLTTRTEGGAGDQSARTVQSADRSADELLAIELTLPGHDVLYEAALAAACGG